MDQLETKLTHHTRFNPFKMTFFFFFTQLEPNQFVMSKHKCGKQAGMGQSSCRSSRVNPYFSIWKVMFDYLKIIQIPTLLTKTK